MLFNRIFYWSKLKLKFANLRIFLSMGEIFLYFRTLFRPSDIHCQFLLKTQKTPQNKLLFSPQKKTLNFIHHLLQLFKIYLDIIHSIFSSIFKKKRKNNVSYYQDIMNCFVVLWAVFLTHFVLIRAGQFCILPNQVTSQSEF